MKRYALIFALALAMGLLPFAGVAQDEAGSAAGAEAGGDPAASCARIQLGGYGEPEGAAGSGDGYGDDSIYEDDVYYDDTMEGDGTYDETLDESGSTDLSDVNLEELDKTEMEEQELMCEEVYEPGPIICYEGETELACEFDGVDVICPY